MSPETQRRLSAVMFTDMVGYSALMQQNEALGLDLLDEHRKIVRGFLTEYGGREIETAGDAFFAEFGSALSAVECAIEIQRAFHERNQKVDESRKILLRIGLHLGDVVHTGDQVHGDGVNIAARMEPLAKPGSICVSEDIARQVHNKIDRPLARLGDRQLKNIRLPVVTYRVVMPWESDERGFRSSPRDFLKSRAADRTGGKTGFASRRMWQAAIAAVMLAAVGYLAVSGPFLSSQPAAERLSASVVAVLPFSVQGNPDFAYLGQGMVDLLSTKLDGAGELRSIDARAVLGMVEQSGQKTFDPDRGKEIAKRLGAGSFVLGNILDVAGQLRIDATVYSSASGQPLEQGSVEGNADGIFELLDGLAAQLIVVDQSGPGTPVGKLEEITTSSFEALKNYLHGVRAFRAARFQIAADELKRAVERDSTFALAWYQLSSTAEWLFDGELALEAASRAMRRRDRLSERGRRLVEALHASKTGNNRDAMRRYRDILASYPDDVEAWYQLAELQFHAGPLVGMRVDESLPTWERLLFYEPDQITALIHICRIALTQDDWARFDSLANRVMMLEPAAERNVELKAHQALRGPNDVLAGPFAELLRNAGDDLLAEVAWSLGSFRDDPAYMAALVPFFTDPARSTASRGLGLVIEGYVATALGRIEDARKAFERAGQIGYPDAHTHRGLLSILPFRSPSEDEIAAMLDDLRSWDPSTFDRSRPVSVWFGIPGLQRLQFKHYLTGILHAIDGDTRAAQRSAAELAAIKTPALFGSIGSDLAISIRAQISLTEGDTRAAERDLAAIERSIWYQFGVGTPFGSLPREQFIQGRLLEDRGEYRQAVAVMGFPRNYTIYDWAYVAPSHLRRAASFEALGDKETAARHYKRFIELWANCDPELRPLIDQARSKLADLGS